MEELQKLKNMGYKILTKDKINEVLILQNKDTIIRVNFYFGTFKKYNKKTKEQIPFIFQEIELLYKFVYNMAFTKNYNF